MHRKNPSSELIGRLWRHEEGRGSWKRISLMAVSEKQIGRGINATFVSSISPTHTRLREDRWHDRTRVSKAGRERSEVRQENLLTIGVLGAASSVKLEIV